MDEALAAIDAGVPSQQSLASSADEMSRLWMMQTIGKLERQLADARTQLVAAQAQAVGLTIERSTAVVFDASAGASEANWKREAAAVRALAAAWAEVLPEISPQAARKGGSVANLLRSKCGWQCNWQIGDWVWVPKSPVASYIAPVAAAAEHPALAKVIRCYANGALEVAMFDGNELCFSESELQTLPPCSTAFEMQQQALPLICLRPRYIGEAVRLVRKRSYKDVYYKGVFVDWAYKQTSSQEETQIYPPMP
jgi:hypothetical protein